MKSILTIQEIEELGNQLRRGEKRVVLAGGCFDLLHFGHVTFLEEAKKQGDILVVLLESDAKIKKIKGNDRPLHTQKQRSHMLKSLTFVDYIILLPDDFTDAGYENVVKTLQPAIIAATKGSDSLRYITKQAHEVHARVYLIDAVKNLSTSRIIDTLQKEV